MAEELSKIQKYNYGHGKQSLSSVLASLIILAFLVHTVLERMDNRYQLLDQLPVL